MPYDFSNGKIYKLVCDVSDSFYVGSTTTALSKRRFQHSHRPMPGVKLLFDEIGWKELKIVLVEAWPCDNNEELRQRERYWYDKLKPDLNRKRPHVTTAEKRVYHAAYDLEYRAKPGAAEKAKVRQVEYRADPVHKERMRSKKAEKIPCCCGSEVTWGNILRHQRTSKHHLLYAQVVADFIHS